MNRRFGWRLSCDQDLEVPQSKNGDTTHPTMRFADEEAGVVVTLILNRLPLGVLAKGASGLDYLMMFKLNMTKRRAVKVASVKGPA